MITSAAMGLRQWDQPNDLFSYIDLSNNFGLIDAHDHSSGKGMQIPTNGIANLAVDTTKIADSAVTANKIANATVSSGKLDVTLSGQVSSLLSSLNVWRPLPLNVSGSLSSAHTVNVKYMFAGNTAMVSGATYTPGTAFPPSFFINVPNYALTGYTPKLRLQGYAASNGVDPGGSPKIRFYLVPLTLTGFGNVTMSFGAAITTGPPSVTLTGANKITSIVLNNTINLPAVSGLYTIVVDTDTTIAANSIVQFGAYLETSWV